MSLLYISYILYDFIYYFFLAYLISLFKQNSELFYSV